MNTIDFNIPEYHIDSISKLMDIASRVLYKSHTLPQKWLYRGEPKYDSKYGLRPGIGRLIDKLDERKILKFEIEAFNQFKIKSFNELKYHNDYITLAAAQHHGLKTRLLDWSLNLLSALYFAVEDGNQETTEDGALFAFQLQSQYGFNDFGKRSSPFSLTGSDYYFLFTPYVSPRIRAQQGVFQLFTNPFKSFEEAFNLIKLRIPAKKKDAIKRQLYEMGVHAEFLFPDLEGTCKSINYYCMNI